HWIRALAVTPDNRHVISASERPGLKIWSLADGTEVATLRGHAARINAVVVTPDASLAISGSDDHTVRIWDITTGAELRKLEEHGAAVNALATDGRLLVSAGDDCVLRVWELETGQLLTRFSGESPFLACAVSPRGNIIVAGDQSGRVHFLSLEGFL